MMIEAVLTCHRDPHAAVPGGVSMCADFGGNALMHIMATVINAKKQAPKWLSYAQLPS
ncbi:hypothetical protein [Janthinobacterium sp. PC23-8]|uniref:hypothetical protein n=1 Tax=Janthinobacterium sp. PC23-8 TaxID=2012679 RepID=UPI001594F68A|nr:hypothetical protein [Janthinobacterium sp. PC23-8]